MALAQAIWSAKAFTSGTHCVSPSRAAARGVIAAGADIVGLDCTDRPRAGDPWAQVLDCILAEGAQAFADISTPDEALAAQAAGASYVATTLSGYTRPGMPAPRGPDLALVAELAARLSVPVVAEGRIDTPDLARAALAAGAHAVVVGTMITNPREITRRFAGALQGKA